MRSMPWDSIIQGVDEETGYAILDRVSSASDLREVYKTFFSNGVFLNDENAFHVVPGDGMNVIVSPGKCCIEGTVGWEQSERVLALPSSSSQDFIATIVLRWNANVEMRNIDFYVKAGTAAEVPVRPSLTRSETVWELGICDVFIAKNSGAVSAARITDTRLQTERCGAVTPFATIDTSTFYDQLQAQTQIAVDLAQSAIDGTIAGNLQNQITANKTPAGCVMPYAGKSVPNGWLSCNGALVSREEYSTLFAAIGTTYGAGDGSTTFALPNLQGRFPLGVSGSHALGGTGGAEQVALTVNEIPAHKHTVSLMRGSYANDAYGLTISQTYGGGVLVTVGGTSVVTNTSNAGGGGSHNNMPPFITLNYIISTGDYD